MPSLLILLVLSLSVASSTSATKKRAAKTNAVPAKVETAKVEAAKVRIGETATAQAPVVADIEIAEVSLVPVVEAPPAIARLREAVKDLQMPSETDSPFRVEFWASEKSAISPGEVALFAALKTDTDVEITTIAELLKNPATVEVWMNEEERATAAHFQKLIEILNVELENPQVYLFGGRERTVVIIGKVKGGFGGVITLVVET